MPREGTFFGDRVFTELLRLDEVMAVGPSPVTRVLIKGEFGHRDTQGDSHVKMEAEAGNAAGGWERPRAGSPPGVRRTCPAHTLISGFWCHS